MASVTVHHDLENALKAALEPLLQIYGHGIIQEALHESDFAATYDLAPMHSLADELHKAELEATEGTLDVCCPECTTCFTVCKGDGEVCE